MISYTIQCIARLRQGSFNRNLVITFTKENYNGMGSEVKTGRFDRILACNMQTGGRTDRRTCCDR